MDERWANPSLKPLMNALARAENAEAALREIVEICEPYKNRQDDAMQVWEIAQAALQPGEKHGK